jgi:hypothetical protein
MKSFYREVSRMAQSDALPLQNNILFAGGKTRLIAAEKAIPLAGSPAGYSNKALALYKTCLSNLFAKDYPKVCVQLEGIQW